MPNPTVEFEEAYACWPNYMQRAARNALREAFDTSLDIKQDLQADVVLEGLWNILTAVRKATR